MTCGFLINTVQSASQLYKICFIIWYVFSAVHIMLLPSRKPSSSYSLLKFVFVTSQLRHSLVVHPLLRKILDPPLSRVMQLLHFVFVCVSTIVSLLYMHLFRWAKEKRVNDIVYVHKCTKGTKNVFRFGFTTKSVFELSKRTQNLFSRYMNFPLKTHQESRIIIVPWLLHIMFSKHKTLSYSITLLTVTPMG